MNYIVDLCYWIWKISLKKYIHVFADYHGLVHATIKLKDSCQVGLCKNLVSLPKLSSPHEYDIDILGGLRWVIYI